MVATCCLGRTMQQPHVCYVFSEENAARTHVCYMCLPLQNNARKHGYVLHVFFEQSDANAQRCVLHVRIVQQPPVCYALSRKPNGTHQLCDTCVLAE